MRKTAITVMLAFAAITGYAQSAYDGLLFSEDNYEGTARSVAMGNAFTALGGDLGSITLNPAGSAVAGYSQFTITPGMTFSASTAQGVSPFDDGTLPYFENRMESRMSSFSIPNMGLTLNWDSGRTSGLKNVTFGFISNKSADFNQDVYAKGLNSTTTFMGAMAVEANGYLASDLNSSGAYDYYPWSTVMGYQSGMISTFGGNDDEYVGASELVFDNGDIVLGGDIEQKYGRRVTGGKHDYLFNLGGNISDFLYIGANIGITSLDYGYDEYFKEEAVDPADFEIALDNGESMYFQNMRYDYGYSADGAGVYGKFGIIVTPGYGLRIGAAVQTPTAFTMDETWTQDGKTEFSTGKYSSYSPLGSAQYSFRSPMRANFGLAYTYGALGLISVDYEMADYGTMRYDTSNADREYFSEVNKDINNRFGVSHMLRAGLEVKPLPELAIRAGYSLMTSGEIKDAWGDRLEQKRTQTASFGLGYSSKGSFFADAAVQTRFLGNEYFMPYEDYTDAAGNILEYAPEIINHRSFWKALLTIGWRF
jgi:hypothetical protein